MGFSFTYRLLWAIVLMVGIGSGVWFGATLSYTALFAVLGSLVLGLTLFVAGREDGLS